MNGRIYTRVLVVAGMASALAACLSTGSILDEISKPKPPTNAPAAPAPEPTPVVVEQPKPTETPVGQTPGNPCTFMVSSGGTDCDIADIQAAKSLELFVRDLGQRPIAAGAATNLTTGEVRKVSDGDGRIHFAIRGSVVVEVVAPGYLPQRREVPPGTHVFNLRSLTPEPAPVVAPVAPVAPVSACGSRTVPAHGIGLECVREVAAVSPAWARCAAGENVQCHRFVREVAVALNGGKRTGRWGLVGKQAGQQQCTFDECGSLDGRGFAEDAVAFRPGDALDNWIGFDIVAGAGEPAARFAWNGPLPIRPGNIWKEVPKQ
jgi:hypothetical protein